MINLFFAIPYSIGGAIAMAVVEPLLWIPALIVGRNSPAQCRFWFELPVVMIAAFFLGWRENGYASMIGLDATVEAIQFIRPALAAILVAMLANLLWRSVRRLSAVYRSRLID